MTFSCDCEDWRESFPQVQGAQILAHTHGILYTGKVMRYCPWCGEKLKIDDRETPKEI